MLYLNIMVFILIIIGCPGNNTAYKAPINFPLFVGATTTAKHLLNE